MKISRFKKFVSFLLIFCLCLGQTGVSYAQIQAAPALVPAVSSSVSPMMMGVKVYPQNPFRFDFIIDQGQKADGLEFKTESEKLIRYFLAGLTVPEKEVWVNLNPKEPDRIVSENLGQTSMGRDLLAQDFLLKKLTASLMRPDGETGKKLWERIYQKVYEQYGTNDVPLDVLNRVWIVPEKAVVYEHPSAGASTDLSRTSSGQVDVAYVTESRLKVLLEEEYFQQSENRSSVNTAGIIKEIIIPEIEREVNQGASFANLRQIYHSLILAAWYKRALQNSILNQVYVDQNKIAGLEFSEDRREKREGRMEKREVGENILTSNVSPLSSKPIDIYNQYLKAFQDKARQMIREEYDPVTKQIIPRKYISGGVIGEVNPVLEVSHKVSDPAMITRKQKQTRIVVADLQIANSKGPMAKSKEQNATGSKLLAIRSTPSGLRAQTPDQAMVGKKGEKDLYEKALDIQLKQREIWKKKFSKGLPPLGTIFPSGLARQLVSDYEGKGGERILEIGFDAGSDAIFFAQNGHKVFAVDFLQAAIDRLELRLKELGLEDKVSLGRLDMISDQWASIKEKQFDVIHWHLGFHQFSSEQLKKILMRLSGHLSPNGRIYMLAKSENEQWIVDSQEGSNNGYPIGKIAVVDNRGQIYFRYSKDGLAELISGLSFSIKILKENEQNLRGARMTVLQAVLEKNMVDSDDDNIDQAIVGKDVVHLRNGEFVSKEASQKTVDALKEMNKWPTGSKDLDFVLRIAQQKTFDQKVLQNLLMVVPQGDAREILQFLVKNELIAVEGDLNGQLYYSLTGLTMPDDVARTVLSGISTAGDGFQGSTFCMFQDPRMPEKKSLNSDKEVIIANNKFDFTQLQLDEEPIEIISGDDFNKYKLGEFSDYSSEWNKIDKSMDDIMFMPSLETLIRELMGNVKRATKDDPELSVTLYSKNRLIRVRIIQDVIHEEQWQKIIQKRNEFLGSGKNPEYFLSGSNKKGKGGSFEKIGALMKRVPCSLKYTRLQGSESGMITELWVSLDGHILRDDEIKNVDNLKKDQALVGDSIGFDSIKTNAGTEVKFHYVGMRGRDFQAKDAGRFGLKKAFMTEPDVAELVDFGFKEENLRKALRDMNRTQQKSFDLDEDFRGGYLHSLEDVVLRKNARGEKSLLIYQIGLGKKAKEFDQIISLLEQIFVTKGYLIEDAEKWHIQMVLLDSDRHMLVKNRSKVYDPQFSGKYTLKDVPFFGRYTLKDLPFNLDVHFIQADMLDRECIAQVGRHFGKGDIISNRRTVYAQDRANSVLNIQTLEKEMREQGLPGKSDEALFKILNTYLTTKNVIEYLSAPGTGYIIEPTYNDTAFMIPGAQVVYMNNHNFSKRGTGIYIVRKPELMAEEGILFFLKNIETQGILGQPDRAMITVRGHGKVDPENLSLDIKKDFRNSVRAFDKAGGKRIDGATGFFALLKEKWKVTDAELARVLGYKKAASVKRLIERETSRIANDIREMIIGRFGIGKYILFQKSFRKLNQGKYLERALSEEEFQKLLKENTDQAMLTIDTYSVNGNGNGNGHLIVSESVKKDFRQLIREFDEAGGERIDGATGFMAFIKARWETTYSGVGRIFGDKRGDFVRSLIKGDLLRLPISRKERIADRFNLNRPEHAKERDLFLKMNDSRYSGRVLSREAFLNAVNGIKPMPPKKNDPMTVKRRLEEMKREYQKEFPISEYAYDDEYVYYYLPEKDRFFSDWHEIVRRQDFQPGAYLRFSFHDGREFFLKKIGAMFSLRMFVDNTETETPKAMANLVRKWNVPVDYAMVTFDATPVNGNGNGNGRLNLSEEIKEDFRRMILEFHQAGGERFGGPTGFVSFLKSRWKISDEGLAKRLGYDDVRDIKTLINYARIRIKKAVIESIIENFDLGQYDQERKIFEEWILRRRFRRILTREEFQEALGNKVKQNASRRRKYRSSVNMTVNQRLSELKKSYVGEYNQKSAYAGYYALGQDFFAEWSPAVPDNRDFSNGEILKFNFGDGVDFFLTWKDLQFVLEAFEGINEKELPLGMTRLIKKWNKPFMGLDQAMIGNSARTVKERTDVLIQAYQKYYADAGFELEFADYFPRNGEEYNKLEDFPQNQDFDEGDVVKFGFNDDVDYFLRKEQGRFILQAFMGGWSQDVPEFMLDLIDLWNLEQDVLRDGPFLKADFVDSGEEFFNKEKTPQERLRFLVEYVVGRHLKEFLSAEAGEKIEEEYPGLSASSLSGMLLFPAFALSGLCFDAATDIFSRLKEFKKDGVQSQSLNTFFLFHNQRESHALILAKLRGQQDVYLIDTTFRQFMRDEQGDPDEIGEYLKKRQPELLNQLLKNGYVKLTDGFLMDYGNAFRVPEGLKPQAFSLKDIRWPASTDQTVTSGVSDLVSFRNIMEGTKLWEEFKKLNQRINWDKDEVRDPRIIELSGTREEIIKQFYKRIEGIDLNEIIFLSLKIDKVYNGRGVINHIAIIDTLENIVSGAVLWGKRDSQWQKLANYIANGVFSLEDFMFLIRFDVHVDAFENSQVLDAQGVSLGNKSFDTENLLRNRGLLKSIFKRLSDKILEKYAGWDFRVQSNKRQTQVFAAYVSGLEKHIRYKNGKQYVDDEGIEKISQGSLRIGGDQAMVGYGQRLIANGVEQIAEWKERNSLMPSAISHKPVGGIDLSLDELNLEIRNSGESVTFDPAVLADMNVNGFVPVIVDILPADNLPMMLGL